MLVPLFVTILNFPMVFASNRIQGITDSTTIFRVRIPRDLIEVFGVFVQGAAPDEVGVSDKTLQSGIVPALRYAERAYCPKWPAFLD